MASGWNIDAVVTAFHEAAFMQTRWSHALDTLSREVGAVGVVILPQPNLRNCMNSSSSDSLGEANEAYFGGAWNSCDRRDRGLSAMRERGVAVDLDFMTEDEIKRDEYYQDFLGRFGLQWFAGFQIPSPDGFWCMSIQRTAAQGPFFFSEQQQLAKLAKGLANVSLICQLASEAHTTGLLDGLALSGIPAMIFGGDEKMLHISPAAEALLGPHMRIAQGRFVAADQTTTTAVSRMIDAALKPRDAVSAGAASVAVRRKDRRPLLLSAVPVPTKGDHIFARPLALVLIRDPDAEDILVGTDLRLLFGLTTAEVNVAIGMAQAGNDVMRLAKRLNVGVPTIRTQLQSVFRKTGTSGQAELARLLSRLAVPARL